MPELYNIMNNVFDRSPLYQAGTTTSYTPAANISETDDNYLIELSVPGFKKEAFKIELDNHILTISCEKDKEPSTTSTSLRREFEPMSFSRSFTLKENRVDETNIEATYEAGILSLRLAKHEEAKPKPARLIEIA